MTDNEIMKALETILNREYPEDIVPTAVCTVEFFREIYKFIDRLQGEVCYFEDRIDTINTEKNEIINRQKAEIDILIRKKEALSDEVFNLRAEVERLQKENEIKSSKRANFYEIIDAFERGRVDGIKEFAEKAKDIIDEPRLIRGEVIDLMCRKIDNALNELTENK